MKSLQKVTRQVQSGEMESERDKRESGEEEKDADRDRQRDVQVEQVKIETEEMRTVANVASSLVQPVVVLCFFLFSFHFHM